VIGIGLNVNQEKFPPSLPDAVSLRQAAGKIFDLEDCLSLVLNNLEARYLRLKEGHGKEMMDEYRSRLYRLNEGYSFLWEGKPLHGLLSGVKEDGRLIVLSEGREYLLVHR
jgi:BirA family biotin operon repressor/biotin-[acetyl-CoA-carboxylase] ligase